MARKFAPNNDDALGMTKTVVFAEEVLPVMRHERSEFRELLDAWIIYEGETAEGIYGKITRNRPANSLIGVFRRDGDLEIVGPYKINTDIKFPGEVFLRREVVSACQDAWQLKRPISSRKLIEADGLLIPSEWLVLPHKAQRTSDWCIAYVEIGFLLHVCDTNPRIDALDRTLLQMLGEGCQLKEIAIRVGLSHRTVEHRFEKLKSRTGARTLPHLVMLSIGRELSGLAMSLSSTMADDGRGQI
ncbi:DNA-binding CsgD family transcriptional regulator [Rhizobium sp. BK316]|uniref:helix-turn-helix transcriptional regulator n=1 Tax=Rhizobium sp. BK316 TaxID=2587053 RepID=UPI00160C5896|nr:hypothetical protein [Rhizobium sp. BK316]MBB3411919.1 DNA-binding CsgD family transcriptional regulator [Rhizobium sp. BK316]